MERRKTCSDFLWHLSYNTLSELNSWEKCHTHSNQIRCYLCFMPVCLRYWAVFRNRLLNTLKILKVCLAWGCLAAWNRTFRSSQCMDQRLSVQSFFRRRHVWNSFTVVQALRAGTLRVLATMTTNACSPSRSCHTGVFPPWSCSVPT